MLWPGDDEPEMDTLMTVVARLAVGCRQGRISRISVILNPERNQPCPEGRRGSLSFSPKSSSLRNRSLACYFGHIDLTGCPEVTNYEEAVVVGFENPKMRDEVPRAGRGHLEKA